MSITFVILYIIQQIYIGNGQTCECTDCSFDNCQDSDLCMDLIQGAGGVHHHYLSLTSPGNARVRRGSDGYVWPCTCSDCNGLVGGWTCPGFYDSHINIASDSVDTLSTFSSACTDNCVSEICVKSGCDAVDIDAFLGSCSDKFAKVVSDINDVSSKCDTNANNIDSKSTAITTNTAGITTNAAGIVTLTTDIDAIKQFQAAYTSNGGSIDDYGDNVYNILNPNNIILLISLLTNILLFISVCYLLRNVAKNNKYNKVATYLESDTEQPLKH